jgi:methylglutaconyl-CoA hydratase
MDPFTTLAVRQRRAGVAEICMNRPGVFNAFDEQMIRELDMTFALCEANADVRVIVLSGEGKHFSAGADLQWMQRASAASFDWNLEDARRFAAMLSRIDACAKPIVAKVQGAALGGGVGLLCACDIAIASSNASFAVTEARFGILPAVIGPYLINAVGKRQALRLALTTTRVGAAEALAMGLVHQLAGPEGLEATVDAVVQELLGAGPLAQGEIKQLFASLEVGPISSEVRELTANTIARVRGTQEAREGFAAFLAKRPPDWICK